MNGFADDIDRHGRPGAEGEGEGDAVNNELAERLSRVSLGLGKRPAPSPYIHRSDTGMEKRRDTSATPCATKLAPPSPETPSRLHAMASTAPATSEKPQPMCTVDIGHTPQNPRIEARKVLVLCPPGCLQHVSHDGHQECGQRINVLVAPDGCLNRPSVKDTIKLVGGNDIQLACLADVLRVHDIDYIAHLQRKCNLSGLPTPGFQQRSSWANLFPPSQDPQTPYFSNPNPNMLDNDTPISPDSINAARSSAGAAILAIDTLANSVENNDDSSPYSAMVLCRPPGHHAGPRGCVCSPIHWQRPSMTSSGFCLLNTVGIAAAYARYRYGRGPFGNIAIIDFDIHHGNGTQKIVENLKPHKEFMPLPDSWPSITFDSYKPWLDETDPDHVFFASINLFQGCAFYPGSGGGEDDDEAKYPNIINIPLTPMGPELGNARARAKLTTAQREELCEDASSEFRSRVKSLLMPKLTAFNPDLIILSSGFDGIHQDLYHFLTPDDYYFITSCMMDLRVPVLSILEGGYDVTSALTLPVRKAKGKKAQVKSASPEDKVMEDRYGSLPSDGGLVKGILAHIKALAETGPVRRDRPASEEPINSLCVSVAAAPSPTTPLKDLSNISAHKHTHSHIAKLKFVAPKYPVAPSIKPSVGKTGPVPKADGNRNSNSATLLPFKLVSSSKSLSHTKNINTTRSADIQPHDTPKL